MNNHDLIQYGKEYAKNSPLKFKHCALIVKGVDNNFRIVAKGHNSYIMDLLNHNHSVHAEVAVIEDFMDNHISMRFPRKKRVAMTKNLIKKNNYYMFVIRAGKHATSNPRYSKPCSKCQKKLKDWSFREIYYTI